MKKNEVRQEIDLTKVKKNYEKIRGNKKITPIILASGGSYNPVHKMHIHSYNLAKKTLDNNNQQVIGGFLVPSSNEYVNSKLGDDAIDLKHRTEMIKISCKDSDFISVCPWGYVNGFSAGKEIARYLMEDYPELKEKLVLYFVTGADFAYNCSLWRTNYNVICMARGEETKLIRKDMERGGVAESKSFIIVESEELFDFSSTKVRNQMNKGEYDKEMLDEEVIEYLKKYQDRMGIYE